MKIKKIKLKKLNYIVIKFLKEIYLKNKKKLKIIYY